MFSTCIYLGNRAAKIIFMDRMQDECWNQGLCYNLGLVKDQIVLPLTEMGNTVGRRLCRNQGNSWICQSRVQGKGRG